MKKSSGLRTEIMLTLTLLLGAALLLGGVMMIRLMEKSLLEERLRNLDGLVNLATRSAGNFAPAQVQDNRFPVAEFLADLCSAHPSCQGWQLYDKDLALLESIKHGNGEWATSSRLQQVRLTGESIRIISFPNLLMLYNDIETRVHFIAPVKVNNTNNGLVEFHFALDDIRLQLQQSIKFLLVFVVLYGVVLILIGDYLLRRNVIRPAQLLLAATENIVKGQLDVRLTVSGPREIAELAAAYNQMTSALQWSQEQTNHHIQALCETNKQLQQTRDELIRSEKLASIGQLAAGLAHELGNPLAAVIGYLEILKQSLRDDPQQDILKRTLAETSRIDFLVRELLDFSRSDCNDPPIDVNVSDEMRHCLELIKNQGHVKTMALQLVSPDSVPFVRIGQQKLRQVFINLLLNAVQACPDCGEIEIVTTVLTDKIQIAISDNGHGIKRESLAMIFDPFFTTKPLGQGTGLGLTISLRIIEEAGGNINVDSTTGVGTTFTVTLPIVASV
ncbi:HAMP domain-containing protein [Desulfuromusa kysingii]|uniref:histidine kinase n=1 Tax=Desulfuromusa kysingii TaxID=37625 RepID=A0A1H4E9C1_9BACT|nr:ATP-binding protein [Desulfuromusa kysingii]SEA81664.1 HAMP domain-containing protein [Desulfuromusa kysingii]